MATLKSKWEDLNLTRDEVTSLTKALEDDQFRKLLIEYVQETQNPENKKKYQEEIIQLEAERGVDCAFVNPEPGFVIKTSIDGVQKAFINVCTNPLIEKPSSKPTIVDNNRGLSWSIPHSLTPGRDDYDNKNTRCVVYDVVFHPDTLHLAQNNVQFKKFVTDTAIQGIQDAFKVTLDHRNIKFPKLKYKGVAQATVIRKKSMNPPKLTEEEIEFQKNLKYPTSLPTEVKPAVKNYTKQKSIEKYTTPHYTIKYRSDIDLQEYTESPDCKINSAIPKELVVDIHLPLLKSTKTVNLDISERDLDLICENPAKYKLNIRLPYTVAQNGSAKFDVDKRVLSVVLPVVRVIPKMEDLVREDSGVESDVSDPLIQEISTQITPDPKPKQDTFLSPDHFYQFPAYDLNRENKTLCFVLNVKNVNPDSIKRKKDTNSFHIKFSSIGAGYFPINYSFFAKFDSNVNDDLLVEVWDNNLTIQISVSEIEGSVWLGHNEEEVDEKKLADIVDLAEELSGMSLEELPPQENRVEVKSVHEDEVVFDVVIGEHESSPEIEETSLSSVPEPSPKLRTYSEGSNDETPGGAVRRSILKNRMSRSLSESCADESASSECRVLYTWSDSCISEKGDSDGREVKKTVRFNQHIQRQVFRANSSILGQRRKNQKRARNKRKSLERRMSESENSEEGDERDKWRKDLMKKRSVIKEENPPTAITTRNKKTLKKKNNGGLAFQSQLINSLST